MTGLSSGYLPDSEERRSLFPSSDVAPATPGFFGSFGTGLHNAYTAAQADRLRGDAYIARTRGDLDKHALYDHLAGIKDAQMRAPLPDHASDITQVQGAGDLSRFVGNFAGSGIGSFIDQLPSMAVGAGTLALTRSPTVATSAAQLFNAQHQYRMHLGGDAALYEEHNPEQPVGLSPYLSAGAKTGVEAFTNLLHLRNAQGVLKGKVSPARATFKATVPEGLEEVAQTGVDHVAALANQYDEKYVPGATDYLNNFLAGAIGGAAVAGPMAGATHGYQAARDRVRERLAADNSAWTEGLHHRMDAAYGQAKSVLDQVMGAGSPSQPGKNPATPFTTVNWGDLEHQLDPLKQSATEWDRDDTSRDGEFSLFEPETDPLTDRLFALAESAEPSEAQDALLNLADFAPELRDSLRTGHFSEADGTTTLDDAGVERYDAPPPLGLYERMVNDFQDFQYYWERAQPLAAQAPELFAELKVLGDQLAARIDSGRTANLEEHGVTEGRTVTDPHVARAASYYESDAALADNLERVVLGDDRTKLEKKLATLDEALAAALARAQEGFEAGGRTAVEVLPGTPSAELDQNAAREAEQRRLGDPVQSILALMEEVDATVRHAKSAGVKDLRLPPVYEAARKSLARLDGLSDSNLQETTLKDALDEQTLARLQQQFGVELAPEQARELTDEDEFHETGERTDNDQLTAKTEEVATYYDRSDKDLPFRDKEEAARHAVSLEKKDAARKQETQDPADTFHVDTALAAAEHELLAETYGSSQHKHGQGIEKMGLAPSPERRLEVLRAYARRFVAPGTDLSNHSRPALEKLLTGHYVVRRQPASLDQDRENRRINPRALHAPAAEKREILADELEQIDLELRDIYEMFGGGKVAVEAIHQLPADNETKQHAIALWKQRKQLRLALTPVVESGSFGARQEPDEQVAGLRHSSNGKTPPVSVHVEQLVRERLRHRAFFDHFDRESLKTLWDAFVNGMHRLDRDEGISIDPKQFPSIGPDGKLQGDVRLLSLTFLTKTWDNRARFIDVADGFRQLSDHKKLEFVEQAIAQHRSATAGRTGAAVLDAAKSLDALLETRLELKTRVEGQVAPDTKGQLEAAVGQIGAQKRSRVVDPTELGEAAPAERASIVSKQYDELTVGPNSLSKEYSEALEALRKKLAKGASFSTFNNAVTELLQDIAAGKDVIPAISAFLSEIFDGYKGISTLRYKQNEQLKELRGTLAVEFADKLVSLRADLGGGKFDFSWFGAPAFFARQQQSGRQMQNKKAKLTKEDRARLDRQKAILQKLDEAISAAKKEDRLALLKQREELRTSVAATEGLAAPYDAAPEAFRPLVEMAPERRAEILHRLTELNELQQRINDPAKELFGTRPLSEIEADLRRLDELYESEVEYYHNVLADEEYNESGDNRHSPPGVRHYAPQQGGVMGGGNPDMLVDGGPQKRDQSTARSSERAAERAERRSFAQQILESFDVDDAYFRLANVIGGYKFAHSAVDSRADLEQLLMHNKMGYLFDDNPQVLRENLERVAGRTQEAIVLSRTRRVRQDGESGFNTRKPKPPAQTSKPGKEAPKMPENITNHILNALAENC